MSDFSLLHASILLGSIGILAAIFYGLPMKRKIERLDRIIAEHEAQAREAEQAATRL